MISEDGRERPIEPSLQAKQGHLFRRTLPMCPDAQQTSTSGTKNLVAGHTEKRDKRGVFLRRFALVPL
jgi:hypothetical protein